MRSLQSDRFLSMQTKFKYYTLLFFAWSPRMRSLALGKHSSSIHFYGWKVKPWFNLASFNFLINPQFSDCPIFQEKISPIVEMTQRERVFNLFRLFSFTQRALRIGAKNAKQGGSRIFAVFAFFYLCCSLRENRRMKFLIVRIFRRRGLLSPR